MRGPLPLRYHSYFISGVPAAITLNTAIPLTGTDWLPVIQTMVGGAQFEQLTTALVNSTRKPVNFVPLKTSNVSVFALGYGRKRPAPEMVNLVQPKNPESATNETWRPLRYIQP